MRSGGPVKADRPGFEAAKHIAFDDSSRIILMSDCHREMEAGQMIFQEPESFFAALTYYYKKLHLYRNRRRRRAVGEQQFLISSRFTAMFLADVQILQ